jgi:hypothetical protein
MITGSQTNVLAEGERIAALLGARLTVACMTCGFVHMSAAREKLSAPQIAAHVFRIAGNLVKGLVTSGTRL